MSKHKLPENYYWRENINQVYDLIGRSVRYKEGLKRCHEGERYSISYHIGEGLSVGYGELDDYGFWEFPLFEDCGTHINGFDPRDEKGIWRYYNA